MRNSLYFLLIFAIFSNLQVSLCFDGNPEESFGELYWKTIGRTNSNEFGDQGRGKYSGIRNCYYTVFMIIFYIFTFVLRY